MSATNGATSGPTHLFYDHAHSVILWAEVLSFADADPSGENLSNEGCDGLVSLAAFRLRGRGRSEMRWRLFLLELIYVMLELFTARCFSKYPTSRNRSSPRVAASRRSQYLCAAFPPSVTWMPNVPPPGFDPGTR